MSMTAQVTPGAVPRAPATSIGRRALKFGVVGGTGVVVNLGILALLVESAGWHYLWASLVGIEVSTLTNWALNRSWTWRDRDRSIWSLLNYHVVTFVGMVTQWTVLFALATGAGMHYVLASMVGIAAATAWNFWANHTHTFTPYSPERRRRYRRVALYSVAFLIQLGLAMVLAHDWDTFVFQKSAEEFLQSGTTPYETGAQDPDYIYFGLGLPIQPLWYAYPPLPLLAMALTYWPAAWGLAGAPWAQRALIKLPFIAATLALAYAGRRFVDSAPGAKPDHGRRLERLLLFNPLFILVASVWGQFEALLLLLLVASFFALRNEQWARSGAFWGLAALVKIFPFYLAPLLVVHLVRRSGWVATRRFFGAAAATFGLVSLPFFVAHPAGFMNQVFFMHGARPPGRFSPIAYLYEMTREAGRHFPSVLPSDPAVAGALSYMSFVLTGTVLVALAFAYARRPANEANLVAYAGLSILAGILCTKVVGEQYTLLPIALLLVAMHHPQLDAATFNAKRASLFVWTLTIFMTVAAVFDAAHFLIFIPDDVAQALFGQGIPDVVFSLAASLGLTVFMLKIILGITVSTLLLIPFYHALRLLAAPIYQGFLSAARWLHQFHPAGHRVRHQYLAYALGFVVLLGILVPTAAIGGLGPKREGDPVTVGLEGAETLVFVSYRTDWYNPTLRPDVAAGAWAGIESTPEAGYYNTIAHKMQTDFHVVRGAGADAIVFQFHPAYENQAASAVLVAESMKVPYVVHVDLSHVDPSQAKISLVPDTAESARQLLDGPGLRFWSGLYNIRTSNDQLPIMFVSGLDRVAPTFSDGERQFVARQLEQRHDEDALRQTLQWGPGEALWNEAPASLDDLMADNEGAELWRDAYAAAEREWFRRAFAFLDSDAPDSMLGLIVDSTPPASLFSAAPVEIVATFGGAEYARAGERVSAIQHVEAPLDDADAFLSSWNDALERDPFAVWVAWNAFDEEDALEPTVEYGDALLDSMVHLVSTNPRFHGPHPDATAIPPVAEPPSA